MKKDIKRYLVSTLITFLSAFLSVLALNLEAIINKGEITQSMVFACVGGAFVAGIRAVIKFLFEFMQK